MAHPASLYKMPKGDMDFFVSGQFSGASDARLASREPHLADAGKVEGRLARLYARFAEAEAEPARAAQWRTAAALTTSISEILGKLAGAGNACRHHPRPTRIRVCAFKKSELDTLDRSLAEAARANGRAPALPIEALAELHTMERRTILGPLSRISELTPETALTDAWQAVVLRRRMLLELGAEVAALPGANGKPRRARSHRKAARAAMAPLEKASTGKISAQTDRKPVCMCGAVEHLNRSRRCGTIRTEDGQSAFFSAKAVTGNISDLNEGDAVELTVRRGPLGLTAIRVEAADMPPSPSLPLGKKHST